MDAKEAFPPPLSGALRPRLLSTILCVLWGQLLMLYLRPFRIDAARAVVAAAYLAQGAHHPAWRFRLLPPENAQLVRPG
ncbi:MAG TPA: hypothetical protein VJM47_06795 [Nitrosospira sp.]|nr:hypothetical protein [Nitrosospira sp.]